MIKTIDDFLNRITMYRLILYYLIILLVVAAFFGLFGLLPYSFLSILLPSLFLVLISWSANNVFCFLFQAPTNVESVYISALILALILTPVKTVSDFSFLGWAAIIAMASKYLLAFNKKHFFNPVAISAVITATVLNRAVSWWVGTLSLLPFVFTGGVLIVHKIRRYDLVYSFIFVALSTLIFFDILNGQNLTLSLQKIIFDSPLFFFAFIMLTEPLTTPPTKLLQAVYGAIVGFLITPQVHFGSLYFTPELALVSGNIFSYLSGPKSKLILKLKQKIQLSSDTYDFVFVTNRKISYIPGQYMEWTLPHDRTDSRGNRRYFTLASSPTEDTLRLGIKFHSQASSFKQSLQSLDSRSQIIAGQLAGDFILPQNQRQPLAFIAGGIGITPFRSMVKYLLDKNEKRDIVLIYSEKNPDDFVYRDIFDPAVSQLGIKVVYHATNLNGWIDEAKIKAFIPDYQHRWFYLSGPQAMVESHKVILKKMGLPPASIITDYFPGF